VLQKNDSYSNRTRVLYCHIFITCFELPVAGVLMFPFFLIVIGMIIV